MDLVLHIIVWLALAGIVFAAALEIHNRRYRPPVVPDDLLEKPVDEPCRPLDQPDIPNAAYAEGGICNVPIFNDADNGTEFIIPTHPGLEKPPVVSITPPIKFSKAERLQMANKERASIAKVRAANAQQEIDAHIPLEEVAKKYGYSDGRHLKNAIRRQLAKPEGA